MKLDQNFTAEVAFFSVSEQDKPYAEIVPERRYYDVAPWPWVKWA